MRELPSPGIGTYDMAPPACRKAVEQALEVGYRHVDTAEMYENEGAVGDALDAASVESDEVFLATKIHSRNLGYDDVIENARASRERLGVDVIDLLYVHWPIRTYDPVHTLAAFDDLYEAGVIRHVGVSNFTPDLLETALSNLEAPLFAHQVECHPFLPQADLRRLAREHDHYLVAYSPIAKGTVLQDPVLLEVAERHDATPAQVTLAWLQSKENIVPIPKAATPSHIEENFTSLALTLDEAALERIDGIEKRSRQVDFPEAPWNAKG